MKIVFAPSQCVQFHGNTLHERPLGGTETAVIRLAESLCSLGHEAIVLTEIPNPPLTHPLYAPLSAVKFLGPVDAFIAVRSWKPLLYPIEAKKKFFWTGDAYDQPQSYGLGDKRIADRLDGFLTASKWQAETICDESGFPLEKSWKIGYGIHHPYFQNKEKKKRKRLIYSSTPYRGLQFLPKIFSRIKEKHPDSELQVFSGYKVYDGSSKYDESVYNDFEKLKNTLEAIPNCEVHGNVTQEQLAKEFLKSSILAYPNSFAETGCITALEAQAAGCAVLSTKLGALPETVGEAGVLIEGDPSSDEYQNHFVSELDRLLSDDARLKQFTDKAAEQCKTFTWPAVSKRFLNYLGDAHGLS